MSPRYVPTDPIILSKPGPQTADNILHNFASYSYKISLITWDSIQTYNKDIQTDWQTILDHSNNNDGKKLLISSGGINTGDRNKEFELDFYIESMSTSSTMGVSKITRASNIFEINMIVVEPNGATLLERMNAVLPDENWSEFPFLIKIEFTGHDDEQLIESPIVPATRFIPVRLFNMSFDVQASASVYTLEFIAVTVMKKGHPRHTMLESTELTGSNVGEMLNSLATIFNDKEKARVGPAPSDLGVVGGPPGFVPTNNPLYTPKVQQVADEIVFEIDPLIAREEISPIIADQTMLFVKKDILKINSKLKTQTTASNERQRNTGIIVDKRNKVVQIDKGTNQLAVIEKILMFSEYITEQLNDVNAVFSGETKIRQVLISPEAGLKWWKITFVPILLGWDGIRGQYGTRTIIQIDSYVINDPQNTDTSSLPNVVRNYQYIYTGQNLDIKELELKFNSAYMQALISQQYPNAEDLIVTKTQQVAGGTLQDIHNATATGSTYKPQNTVSTGGAKTTKEQMASTLLENLYRNPGADMVSIDLTIVGDPAYIQQDGIINTLSANKAGYIYPDESIDPFNGAILPDFKDVHIYLSFRTPDDYDENLGLVNIGNDNKKYKASVLRGYYKVYTVNSSFNSGEFTQTIKAIRLYNQFPENKLNPLKIGNRIAENNTFENEKIANLDYPIVTGSKVINAIAATLALVALSSENSNKSSTTLQQQEEALSNANLMLPDDTTRISFGRSLTSVNYKRPESLTISSLSDVITRNNINFQSTDSKSIISKKIALSSASTTTTSVIDSSNTVDIANQFARIGNQANNIAFSLSNEGTITPSVPTERNSLNQLIVNENNKKVGDVAVVRQNNIVGRDWWRSNPNGQINLSLQATNTSPINVRDNIQNILLNNNQSRGIIGSESLISLEGYADEDKLSIRENLAKIARIRKSIINSSDLIIRKSSYNLANLLSQENKIIHNRYNNISYSWNEMGYYPELINE